MKKSTTAAGVNSLSAGRLLWSLYTGNHHDGHWNLEEERELVRELDEKYKDYQEDLSCSSQKFGKTSSSGESSIKIQKSQNNW
ncbi:hypothetical protein AKJ57_02710 [candidate division MSBL1 archaeon SCGC-AAA259A05]|uniref:Uncharacterized protein n=1 Tax=candidate division MSBL1 archaeon SCGC-AAA259A05 TaxID=1698259 RepID=A0A133UA20_9EURY|nr:hypothetical protein AKJ57_02710 [candidate division MSBL1 archaeon SCGC-AAA259A05]